MSSINTPAETPTLTFLAVLGREELVLTREESCRPVYSAAVESRYYEYLHEFRVSSLWLELQHASRLLSLTYFGAAPECKLSCSV